MSDGTTLRTGLEGEAAIVTGAGNGIGEGIAVKLARLGMDVAAFDVDVEAATETAETIRSIGPDASVHEVDVSEKSRVTAGVDEAVDEHGDVLVLVNNAGVQWPTRILDLEEDEWDRQLDVNAKGTFLCSQAVAAHMVARGTDGRIVNIASQVGKIPFATQGAYATSKAGVIAFTKVLARELAEHDITANAVCPGTIDTPMLARWLEAYGDEMGVDPDTLSAEFTEDILLGRIGTPEDVADLVAFLASDFGRYITGQDVNVTGGQTLV